MGDREQFWQAHVDACRVSGETQKLYCERHGIGPKTFRKWRSRLAGTTAHMIAAEGEPHGGEVKGGAKELFSPSFDGPLNRPHAWTSSPTLMPPLHLDTRTEAADRHGRVALGDVDRALCPDVRADAQRRSPLETRDRGPCRSRPRSKQGTLLPPRCSHPCT